MSEYIIRCNKWFATADGVTPDTNNKLAQLFYDETLDPKFDDRKTAVKYLFEVMKEGNLKTVLKDFNCVEDVHFIKDCIVVEPWTVIFSVLLKEDKKKKLENELQSKQTKKEVLEAIEDLNEKQVTLAVYETALSGGVDWKNLTPIIYDKEVAVLIKQKLNPLRTNMLMRYIDDVCASGNPRSEIGQILNDLNKLLLGQVSQEELNILRSQDINKANKIDIFCNKWELLKPSDPVAPAIDFFLLPPDPVTQGTDTSFLG